MKKTSNYPPYSLWALYAFAATAVASIALQNFIWVAVAFFLFFKFKDRQKFDWPQGPFPVATLLFLASYFLGALVGIDPPNSFHTVHKYLTFLLFFLVGAMPLLLKNIKTLLMTLNCGAAFCAIHGIWNHYWNHQDRIDSFSGDKMVFGGMLMVTLLLQIYFLKNQPKNWFHWLSLILIGLGLILTETRGALIGFAAGFILLAWRQGKKWVLIGMVLLCALFFILPRQLKDRIIGITDLHLSYDQNHHIYNSSESRILIWISGIKIIQDYPWGIGQGNLSEIFPRYRLGPMDLAEPVVPHLHNNFLQILAQNGWIGLAAYFFWIVSYFGTSLKFKTMEPEAGNLNWAFTAVFVAVLVWGLTEYTFSHFFMNIQFFLLGLQANLWKNRN